MNTFEIPAGPLLNWAVAKANGLTVVVFDHEFMARGVARGKDPDLLAAVASLQSLRGQFSLIVDDKFEPLPDFSSDWRAAGPIIAHHWPDICAMGVQCCVDGIPEGPLPAHWMRMFAASKLGTEIDIPQLPAAPPVGPSNLGRSRPR